MVVQLPRRLWVMLIPLMVVVFYFIYGIQPYRVCGSSMWPTYKDGDVVLVELWLWHIWQPRSGDIVVFTHDDTTVIKRISFDENDTLPIDPNHQIIWQNQPWPLDNYVFQDLQTRHFVIPNKSYFFIGDNATSSIDSRQYGIVMQSQLIGRVLGAIALA
jgi:signal peptidase I